MEKLCESNIEKRLKELYDYSHLLHGLWAAPYDVSHASDEHLEKEIDETEKEIFQIELKLGILIKNQDGFYSHDKKKIEEIRKNEYGSN